MQDGKLILQEVKTNNSQDTELISINLIYDYPVHWGKFKTLRDFIQNFYDAVRWPQWDSRFSWTLADGVLTLTAQEVGFSYDWLLHIGASTKREEKGHYAGYFGEGFKIAALCGVRDHHWNVAILSRDWELEVVTTQVEVDHRSLKSLAYKIKKNQPESRETILKISPFNDRELLNSVLLSFYYPTNPLFGQPIFSSETCAVYHRSSEQKPFGYPRTDREPAIVANLIGPFLFLPKLRSQPFLKLHRGFGTVYLVGVLMGGAGELYLSFLAYGGLANKLGFMSLGVLWLWTGYCAYHHIWNKRIALHREWMIRNYALTYAGVMLRLWQVVGMMAGLEFGVSYAIVAWLSWIPNLIVAEWIIQGTRSSD